MYRYTEVNRNDKPEVKEVFFKKGQLIKTRDVNFEVKDIKLSKNEKDVNLNVYLDLTLLTKTNYGFHKNNLNFMENIWFNIPYAMNGSINPEETKNLLTGK